MQASVDNRVIDRRIAELCKEWMDGDSHYDVSANLKPTLQAVFNEGLTANRGGKRLRALLALAAFESYQVSTAPANIGKDSSIAIQNHSDPAAAAEVNASGQNLATTHNVPNAILDLACAIEIYQTSALVHDDIIDDSPLRRGRPSAHVALTRQDAPSNLGTGLALMLGNMLATASLDIAARALESPELQHANDNLHTFAQMQRAVEIGQTLDLGAETISLKQPDKLIDASLNVFAWKTASYTTIAPLELGLCAAGMSPETACQAAHDIGLPLGIAFQLADDLLDVTGTSQSTGKPVGGDIREGKHTVLLADALKSADTPDRDRLINFYQQPTRNEAEVANVLDLFASTGAIDISRKRIHDLWKQTKNAIDKTDMTSAGRATLTAACTHFIPDELK
ncbi:polyprenyl synthetase family protein [Bifidobacterium sp. ESL0690]|uniref:polyprenyl synthetase family protein n=1 Tax=Bifidobacterium sp. ESL0690 TaxID=2983214 RepID=UPI0023F97D68|nr:polyprenyl synthetase family protein [Bifidobacterium sp. ESL0690]WEV46135.1 polyprenyl synthetase family protein [Bifidobacterium sp. ESL0690]